MSVISGSGLIEALLAVSAGIALAAAAGLRIFVPLLAVSIAGTTGHLALPSGTTWLGTLPALVAIGLAAALEIAGYFLPVLDHALDALGAPLAVAAGVLASASMLVDFPPLLRWTLAVVTGGGSAGLLHSATALLRLKSGVLTAGLANPVVATGEVIGAVVLAGLALLLPLAALVLAVLIGVKLVRRARSRKVELRQSPQ
jgi:hypothetical protein